MRFLAHALLALLFVLPRTSASAQDAAQPHPFAHAGIAKDGERYETYLKANWKAAGNKATGAAAEGEKVLGSDPRAASRNFAAAVVADSQDVDAWIGLARALLAIKPDPDKGSERYDLPVNASGAAYIAYQRAQDAGRQGARALRARRGARSALLSGARPSTR